MLGTCFFVVCLTVNQCLNYAGHVDQFLPDVQLEQFYWRNPNELQLTEHQHDLHEIMQSLEHWTFTNPSAMHFLPYYWYSQRGGECSNLIKLDPDLLFAQPAVDYTDLFNKVITNAIDAGVVFSTIERDCETESSIESANVVVNVPRYLALLAEFDRVSENKFYVDGMFDRFLRSSPVNLQLMPSSSVDLTLCLTDTTVSWTAPTHDSPHAFLRVVLGDDTLYSTVVPAHADSNIVKVF